MYRLLIIRFSVAFILLAAMVSCGSEYIPSDHGMPVDTAVPAPRQGKLLADSLSPVDAAEAVVAWLCVAKPADRVYAQRLTRCMVSGYGRDSIIDSAERFTYALDSITASLDMERQVHIFTVVATPGQLAAKVCEDADSAMLKAMIEKELVSDADALASFRAAMARHTGNKH